MNLHIITGASKGLGAALAHFFVSRGDDVVDISRTPRSSHPHIKHFSFDLASGGSIDDLVAKILSSFDLEKYATLSLTNNAGMIDPINHVAHLDEALVAKNFAVNLTAPIALTSSFLRKTENFPGLRIITNISSGVATNPIASWACYSAAKAGLKSFTTSLAKDYSTNPKVKMINFGPGIIDTDLQTHIRGVEKDRFPEVDLFKNYKDEKKLRLAEEVAVPLGEYILKNNFKNLSEITINDLIKS